MKAMKEKFKKGAASFYIVAFSTLILLIVATSFATVIISEIERTSNDDLSQSAYDSAMAGIEDGKLAFYSYQNCLANGGDNCAQIQSWMENSDCYVVGRVLGRYKGDNVGEVKITESGENNMQQAYTCVKVSYPSDYRATLSGAQSIRVVRVKFDKNVDVDRIEGVRVSWYSSTDRSKYRFANFSGNSVKFPRINGSASLSAPPTISVALVQTAQNFTLDDFDTSRGGAINGETNRGMVYLVPTDGRKKGDNGKTYRVASWECLFGEGPECSEDDVTNVVRTGFWESNNKTSVNLPYAVDCSTNSSNGTDFACSADLVIPNPVGTGGRNRDTFMVAVALPYGGPDTEFKLQFLCEEECEVNNGGSVGSDGANAVASLRTQVEIDSTGRANDIYRRVAVRLEPGANNSNLSLLGPLELLGSGTSSSARNEMLLEKNLSPTVEYNF